ncbi:C-type lectin domain family 4 member F-like isoform X2 [Hemicordylus capensis]|uniref:C-type lectin domain family 4 member F-like isoform X2 n=1 Tax=Hemicordylus capensis TaxID=884348 RepID=UPI0023033AFD|nr:C-type lectin domain family 4 member F-like isoform X2 [Hemicordylus capensis]
MTKIESDGFAAASNSPRTAWAAIGIIAFFNLSVLIASTYFSIKLAEEVERGPQKVDDAEKTFNRWKQKYRALIEKEEKRSSSGWRLHGRNRYYISKGEKTWYDAEKFCMAKDSHLASVLSEKEQRFITSQLKRPAWIGLTDENEEGMWEWTDGSQFTTQYWSAGEPSKSEHYEGGEEDCTSIVPSATGYNWNDADCHKLNGWVCKDSLEVDES